MEKIAGIDLSLDLVLSKQVRIVLRANRARFCNGHSFCLLDLILSFTECLEKGRCERVYVWTIEMDWINKGFA